MSENNCLFCRIISGEIPSNKVYESELAFAFRDINPQAPTHVLIVPKKHIASLNEASQDDQALLGHLALVASDLANQLGIAAGGYRTVINTGAGAGQSVWHIHVHLLGGRDLGWPPG
ncbi:MAG TPA: histidine triad nucleotide-binding protein [Blastocatellia bacterium]|nr:histidine triad nucleotide-binding protein [Blastocatellia bacterium]